MALSLRAGKPTDTREFFAGRRTRRPESEEPDGARPGIKSALGSDMQPDVWSVILAAGAGRRLASITGGVPKQFWRPRGKTSLLDDTIDRLAPLVPTSRMVTVVDESHRSHVNAMPMPDRLGEVVYQPEDRGTAAGALLGVLSVIAEAPGAIVVLTPSDHGVRCPNVFRQGLRTAFDLLRREQSRVVLFGVQPDRACGDYGWIVPDRAPRPDVPVQVAGFVEKPPAGQARALREAGAVWSTMVVAARGSALVTLFARHLPDLYAALAPLTSYVGADRQRYLQAIYPALERCDFSRDLLEDARDLSLFVWPATMGWSDLGTPDRLMAWCGAEAVSHLTASSAA